MSKQDDIKAFAEAKERAKAAMNKEPDAQTNPPAPEASASPYKPRPGEPTPLIPADAPTQMMAEEGRRRQVARHLDAAGGRFSPENIRAAAETGTPLEGRFYADSFHPPERAVEPSSPMRARTVQIGVTRATEAVRDVTSHSSQFKNLMNALLRILGR